MPDAIPFFSCSIFLAESSVNTKMQSSCLNIGNKNVCQQLKHAVRQKALSLHRNPTLRHQCFWHLTFWHHNVMFLTSYSPFQKCYVQTLWVWYPQYWVFKTEIKYCRQHLLVWEYDCSLVSAWNWYNYKSSFTHIPRRLFATFMLKTKTKPKTRQSRWKITALSLTSKSSRGKLVFSPLVSYIKRPFSLHYSQNRNLLLVW